MGAQETDSASSRHFGLRLFSAFVVGFVGLSLEIAYTRVISFKLFYYYTYFVIGLALLGLGAASAALVLRKLRRLKRALMCVIAVSGCQGLLTGPFPRANQALTVFSGTWLHYSIIETTC